MKKTTLRMLTLNIVLLTSLLAGCDLIADPPPGTVLFSEYFTTYPLDGPPGGSWILGEALYDEVAIKYGSNHKLVLQGPLVEEPPGYGDPAAYVVLPGIEPNYVTFKVHPYPQGVGVQSLGWFTLRGRLSGCFDLVPILWIGFVQGSNGHGMIFVAGHIFPENGFIDLDQPFLIELRDIDWQAMPNPTYDLYINEALIAECLRFDRPVAGFERLDLSNVTNGRASFDDIIIMETDVEHVCVPPLPEPETRAAESEPLPVVPEPSPLPSATSTPTLEPPTFVLDVNAFCRRGPATVYDDVTTFNAETVLNVEGRNRDDSWWWIGGYRCWISDAVGRFQGSAESLPMIEAPPSPEPTAPPVCRQDLPEGECLAAGGTWVEGPTEAPHCDCQDEG